MKENKEEDGIVVGDETRLRQIITNLARLVGLNVDWCRVLIMLFPSSNACKFTPTGGKLEIRTKLILPHLHHQESQDSTAVAEEVPKNDETSPPPDAPGKDCPLMV